MKLIDQSHEWLKKPSPEDLKLIELAGRTCYKSEEKITNDSAKDFYCRLMRKGHKSVAEHAHATVRLITNRGVTHELVRHRIASFSQESTRYVNYKNKDMEFIKPVWWGKMGPIERAVFLESCEQAEANYRRLIFGGHTPQEAREVLTNALKTEIVVTANFREWQHIFNLRTSEKAHPQIRALLDPVEEEFWKYLFGGEL